MGTNDQDIEHYAETGNPSSDRMPIIVLVSEIEGVERHRRVGNEVEKFLGTRNLSALVLEHYHLVVGMVPLVIFGYLNGLADAD